MKQPFKDHFSALARQYGLYRPGYPDELFVWLASAAAPSELAWDCACGTGQAAVQLAQRFDRVVATDASAEQIRHAVAHERVRYRRALAQESGLAEQSVDLVTVAQALHWLELESFYREVRRVLKPGGILAVWSYGPLQLANPDTDAPIQHFYHTRLKPYWPAERRYVESGYRSLPFPFRRMQAPRFTMSADWTKMMMLGYLSSWSASKICAQKPRDRPATGPGGRTQAGLAAEPGFHAGLMAADPSRRSRLKVTQIGMRRALTRSSDRPSRRAPGRP